MILGLDTASVAGNQDADWGRAKAEGPIGFAIIRSNFGEREDAVFKRDWPKLKDAGLVRGAYLFLRFPRNGAEAAAPEAQARALIDTLGPLDAGDLPPALDVEFPGQGRSETGLSAPACLDRVRACHAVLKAAYGFAPLVYTSGRVWRDDLLNLPAPELVESPLWLARYPFKAGPAMRDPAPFAAGKLDPPVPPPWGDDTNWWIHQYQGDASGFPGFPTGNVDVNRFHAMAAGATGDRVKWVQRRLALAQTGVFDDATATAVRAFQTANGLTADGAIGPRTFSALCRAPVG